MLDRFTSAHVSGDLEQVIARNDDGVFLIDRTGARKATAGDVNLFFDEALEVEELDEDVLKDMGSEDLSLLVQKQGKRTSAVHKLVMGMDGTLPDELRSSAIVWSVQQLDNSETLAFVRDRFLRASGQDSWDHQGATRIALERRAFWPALFYRAIGNRAAAAQLRTKDPSWWSRSGWSAFAEFFPQEALTSEIALPAQRLASFQVEGSKLSIVLDSDIRLADASSPAAVFRRHAAAAEAALRAVELLDGVNWAQPIRAEMARLRDCLSVEPGQHDFILSHILLTGIRERTSILEKEIGYSSRIFEFKSILELLSSLLVSIAESSPEWQAYVHNLRAYDLTSVDDERLLSQMSIALAGDSSRDFEELRRSEEVVQTPSSRRAFRLWWSAIFAIAAAILALIWPL